MLKLKKVLLLAVAVAVEFRGEHVTQEDREIAALARASINQHCHGQKFKGNVDQLAGYAELQKSLGGDNVVLEVLSQSNSIEETPSIFMDEYGMDWIIRRSLVLVIGVIMFVFGGFFFFAKKCRCCAYERPTWELQKTCVMVIISITLVGIVWYSVSAISGFETQQMGFQNVRCTLARFLDHAALGDPQNHDTFVGLLPLLRKLEGLEQTLDEGTAFNRASESNILQETDNLNKAARLANESLALLTKELKANKKLKLANNESAFHDCILCQAALPYVTNASRTMMNSIAMLLGQTRAEVDRSIQNDGKNALKKVFRKTTDAVVAWKDIAIDGSRKMYKDELFATLTQHEETLKWLLFAAVLLVSMSALALIVTATLSVYRFKYHEMINGEEDEERQMNPYNKLIHQQARRTWCWAFVYVTLALIVAGTLNIIVAPFSSFCLVLHDLDGAKLEQIAPGLNLSKSGEAVSNWKEIVDKCVQQSSAHNVNTSLLDMLVTKQGDHAVSLRESLRQNARDVVQSQFSSIVKSSAGAAVPLLTDPVMQKLRQVFANNPVDRMVIGNRAELEASDLYSDIHHDDSGGKLRNSKGSGFTISQLGLGPVLNSSLACPNYTSPASLGNFSEITIAGIAEFAGRLGTLGDLDPSTGNTCAKNVVCKTTEYWHNKVVLGYNLAMACHAGNRYMNLKRRLQSEDVFRCSLFTNPSSSEACDPKDMQNLSGTYKGDCLDSDGAVKVLDRTCNLNEFISYMQSWDERLAKVLQRADAELARIRISVKVALVQLIGEHIETEIDALSSGMTCNFVNNFFHEGIDGFCYQGVVGTRRIASSYVQCAIWTAMLIPTMWWVYCRSKGNYENWNPDRTQYTLMKRRQDESMDALLGRKGKETPKWLGDPEGTTSGARTSADLSDSDKK